MAYPAHRSAPARRHSILGHGCWLWAPVGENSSFTASTCSLHGAVKPTACLVVHTSPNSFAEPHRALPGHAWSPALSKQLPPLSCNQESIKTTSKLISEILLQVPVTSC